MNRLMIKAISILLFALLLSCSSNSNEKGKMQDKSKDYFVIDTLLSDYQTKLKLSQAHFKKVNLSYSILFLQMRTLRSGIG